LAEFDYQWKNLPSKDIEFNDNRISEFLKFTRLNPRDAIGGRYCLDAGCGNGRFTYAMRRLGAMRVDSFDISAEAIAKCKGVNPAAFVFDIMDLKPLARPIYDFVFSWGVIHHTADPRKAFSKLVSQVNGGGILHIMVYHQTSQEFYGSREIWPNLSLKEKLELCEQKVKSFGGTVHGWFDALNPKFNWGFTEKEVKRWFEEEGFSKIRVITKNNINIQGQF
jgi:SAM-dependent methyltransferase